MGGDFADFRDRAIKRSLLRPQDQLRGVALRALPDG
jgi:hypothetical protein